MSSPVDVGGRKRAGVRTYTAEDQALNSIAQDAEARLAMRRAARAEAREIRMRELEKQAKENEEKQDRHYEIVAESRSTQRLYNKIMPPEEADDPKDLRREVNDLEERYKKAMMNSAQLDNEKKSYRYQVDLMKDQFHDLEEQLMELKRYHKETCKDLEAKNRANVDLERETNLLRDQVKGRDALIEQYGLVYIANEANGEEITPEGESIAVSSALVTPEVANILQRGEGNIDKQIKILSEEKEKLEEECRKLRQQLEEEKAKNSLSEKFPSPKQEEHLNGPDPMLDMQIDSSRQIQEYKIKLKKYEQDITTLEGNVLRLESQAKRYKSAAETAETQLEDSKQEKRKIQREFRESQNQIEELTTANNSLQKRLDKLKKARNDILKS